jgi:hypothetical protein
MNATLKRSNNGGAVDVSMKRKQSMILNFQSKSDKKKPTFQMSQIGLMDAVRATKNNTGHKALAIIL